MISNDFTTKFEEEKRIFISYVNKHKDEKSVQLAAHSIQQNTQKIITDVYKEIVDSTNMLAPQNRYGSEYLNCLASKDQNSRKGAASVIWSDYRNAIKKSQDSVMIDRVVLNVKAAFEKRDRELNILTQEMFRITGGYSPSSVTSERSSTPVTSFMSPVCPHSASWKESLKGSLITPDGKNLGNVFAEN